MAVMRTAHVVERPSTGAFSVVSSQMQDDDQLALSSAMAWHTADGTASRVVPYLFTSDHPVRAFSGSPSMVSERYAACHGGV
jgi:hypothetical protein